MDVPAKREAGFPLFDYVRSAWFCRAITWLFALYMVWQLGKALWPAIRMSLTWNGYQDSPIFSYIARRVLDGAVPYKDIFDFNFPGIYVINMALQALFGRSDFALRMCDLAFCAAIVGVIVLFCWRGSKVFTAFGACYFMAIHMSHGGYAVAQRDLLMVPFLLMGGYCLHRFIEELEEVKWLGWCGLLVGCAFWIKPQAAVFGGMAALAVMVQPLRPQAMKTGLMWLLLGFAVPFALMHLWLGTVGGLGAFYDIFLNFTLPIYSKLGAYTRFGSWDFSFSMMRLALMLGVLLMACDCGRGMKIVLSMGLIFGMMNGYSQKAFFYQFYPLWGFEAVYFGYVLPRLRLQLSQVIVICALILHQLLPYNMYEKLSGRGMALHQRGGNAYSAAYEKQVSRDAYAALASVPDDIRLPYMKRHRNVIQVFDYVSAGLWKVAYREGWGMPTRHIYPFGLFKVSDKPYLKQIRYELRDQLWETMPLVILMGSDSFPRRGGTVWKEVDVDPEWRPFFAYNYTLVSVNAYYRVYARKR